MAQVIGTSQAWQQVMQTLRPRNLNAENADDLRSLLNAKIQEHEKRKNDETKSFDDELQNLVGELKKQKDIFQSEKDIRQNMASLEVEWRKTSILILQDEKGIIRRLFNNQKIQKLKNEIRHVEIKQKNYLEENSKTIIQKEQSIKYRQTNRETIIAKNCSSISQDITLLNDVLSSPEFAGAIAELELIELLKKLPADTYIINGITLVRDRAIRFEGKWLKSAQIDHLVITPAAVFVIEVKNWSKEFAQHGNYFDPYDQVKRASDICYKILRSSLFHPKVKSILAYRGSVPEKPKDSYTKVLHLNNVNNHILSYREKVLSDPEIKNMILILRAWSKDGF